jgi:hypothetical protein
MVDVNVLQFCLICFPVAVYFQNTNMVVRKHPISILFFHCHVIRWVELQYKSVTGYMIDILADYISLVSEVDPRQD